MQYKIISDKMTEILSKGGEAHVFEIFEDYIVKI